MSHQRTSNKRSFMEYLLYLSIILLQVGQLAHVATFDAGIKSWSLSPMEPILFVILCGYVLRSLCSGRLPFAGIPGIGLILFFPLWAAFSLSVNAAHFDLTTSQAVFSGLYLMRWMEYSLFYLITYEIIREHQQVKKLVCWLTGAVLVFCIFGLIQAAFLPDFAFMIYPTARPYLDFDPQGHRLVSTFLDPNLAATYISILALMSLSFMLHGFRRWLMLSLIFSAGVVVSLSRGGNLGFACGFLALVLISNVARKRIIIVGLGIVILAVALYPVLQEQIESTGRFEINDASSVNRVEDWEQGLQIIADNPILGVGFNTLGFVLPRYRFLREGAGAFGLAGDFITIWALTGIIGLGVYIGIFWKMARTVMLLRRKSSETWDNAFGAGVLAAIVSILINSCFTSVTLYPQIIAVLWICSALTMRLLKTVPFPAGRTVGSTMQRAALTAGLRSRMPVDTDKLWATSS